ncbi:hypothetical protein GCM10020358_70780 [Amorphoplanes nipponensis]|uniref:Uncharacterized protein n=1 Tax=Actinoplanes nipponensis TaxID=135950 RepID=A0A919MM78_9ACTN|nr:hypothetical protein Ani05nite_06670 [Actinoplanes nipponensis]
MLLDLVDGFAGSGQRAAEEEQELLQILGLRVRPVRRHGQDARRPPARSASPRRDDPYAPELSSRATIRAE